MQMSIEAVEPGGGSISAPSVRRSLPLLHFGRPCCSRSIGVLPPDRQYVLPVAYAGKGK